MDGIRGVALWGVVAVVCVRVYGKKAYRLDLLSTAVRWHAPLRRGQVAIADIATVAVVGGGAWRGEHHGTITARSGDEIAISIPNRKHADRFLSFCDTLRLANPHIVVADERKASARAG